MGNKAKKEKKNKKKKQRSLQGRVFRISLLGGLILGVVSLLIGLVIYSLVLFDQYTTLAFNLSQNTSTIVDDVVDIADLTDHVSSIYHGLTEEEKSNPDTEEYLNRYAEVTQREDYKKLIELLGEYTVTNNVDDMYVVMYDDDTDACIYIADPEKDPELVCPTGFWEEIDQDEVDKFQNWDGKDKIYGVSYAPGHGFVATSGVPFRDSEGNIICYIMVDVSIRDLVYGMRDFVIWYFIALAIIITVYIFFVMRIMKKSIIRPINRVTDAAKNYASDKLEGKEGEEHFEDLGIDSGDEIENLANTMADMEKDIGSYVENLMEVTKERERIGAELSVATQIQANMLPKLFPHFPERKEVELYASMTPAKEVGGDFFDFFYIDEDHLVMVMADVSGKGVPAALFMVIAKTLIKDHALMGELSPAEILTQTNERLCEGNDAEYFVTVWLAIIDLKTGKGMAANAGHEHPAIRRAGGSFELSIYKHSPAVATMEGLKFREHEFEMKPGDSFFVYTDGVPEATNANDELYGPERMLEALNKDPEATPAEILENVRKSVDDFVGDAPQFDDLTMLCFKYKGC